MQFADHFVCKLGGALVAEIASDLKSVRFGRKLDR